MEKHDRQNKTAYEVMTMREGLVTTAPLHELPGKLHGRSHISTRAESASRGPFERGSNKCGRKWPFCAPNGEKGHKCGEEVDKTMSGGGETELAAESAHVKTRSMTKAVPLKEGFFCSALNTRNLRMEETTEEEKTPQSKRPARRKGRPADLPSCPRTWPKK